MEKISFKNFIQIAGIIDFKEAQLLTEAGVKFLGFPLRLPVNKEDLPENEAKEIISKISSIVNCIGITYSSTAEEAIDLCNSIGCNIIQLHGPIHPQEIEKLRTLQPELTIIKSLVINERNETELIKTLHSVEKFVDAFITDTYDPSTGASGATGKTHNWDISKNLVMNSHKPVVLAGGINPDNVYEAIKFVKPAGVDVHTGVENISGRKDQKLVQKFLIEAQKAFNEI